MLKGSEFCKDFSYGWVGGWDEGGFDKDEVEVGWWVGEDGVELEMEDGGVGVVIVEVEDVGCGGGIWGRCWRRYVGCLNGI